MPEPWACEKAEACEQSGHFTASLEKNCSSVSSLYFGNVFFTHLFTTVGVHLQF